MIQINVGDIILDLYKVTKELGKGGFGKVYQVHHQDWNIDLAVKVPQPQFVATKNGVENFEREAETWVNLGLHPHIVSCYYVRRIESSPLVFAEYVAGGSLRDWIEQRQLYRGGSATSLIRILDIAIQFAWGLHYAHEQGLIHQDVKPANAMLTLEGMVKVTDFGLANARTIAAIRQAQASEGEVNTLRVAGSGAMTPAYCSPEQANKKTLTRRTDLWSWALSVLEMFQGELTWRSGVIAAEVLEYYLQTGSSDPNLPQMPIELASLLRRCFRENPDDRPHDMQEVAAQLQKIYQQEIGSPYPRQEPQAGKDIADSLNNRAVSLLDLGRQNEALQLWQQALQIQPQHPGSTYNRGLLLWRTGKIADGSLVRDLEESQRSYPNDKLVNQLLGWIHLERDDCEAAIESLSKIQIAGIEQEEAQRAMAIAQKRLPDSKRLWRTFEKQISGINSICLSADNRLALSGTWNLQLWNVTTGKCLRTFVGHKDEVTSVSLSADGRFALSGSDDRKVNLWEVDTGKCLRTFAGHEDEVTSVSLSADGRFALSGSRDKTLKLWEVTTGKCLRTFTGHQDEVNSICLSADDRFALSGSRDKTLKLWEVATGKCLRTFTGHQDQVNSVSLSTDNQFSLSGSDDKTLKLWEVSTGRCLRTFEGETSGVYTICLSRDSRFALSGNRGKTVKLWEVATGRCLRTFRGHTSLITSVCLSADGQFALSSEIEDETVKLWTINGAIASYVAPMMLSQVIATETVLSLDRIYEQELAKAQVAYQQGNYAIAAQHIRQARSQPGHSSSLEAFNLWSQLYIHLPRKTLLGSWECVTFAGHKSRISSLCLSADGRFVLSGSSDRTLKLWEIDTRHCIHTFSGHTDGVTSVSFSLDGCYAISAGGNDRNLKLWKVKTGECLRTFKGYVDNRYNDNPIHTSLVVTYEGEGVTVTSVCLSPDGRLALSGSNNKTIAIWEVSEGRLFKLLKEHQDEVNSICLSPDSRFVLSGSKDKTVKLWEVAKGKCLHTFIGHQDEVTSICSSADSRLALSGSSDSTLKLWAIDTGNCIRTLRGHTDGVTSVSLSLDGRYALSGSRDKTMKLWDVRTGRCLRTFEGHAAGITAVSLSPDGRYAVSGSNYGTLKIWFLDWELEDRLPADWDEGARPYLKTFLSQHTPYLRGWFRTSAIKRSGTPTSTEEDFQNLLYTLGCAGYGWLRRESIEQQLQSMAANWQKPSVVSHHANPSTKIGRGAKEMAIEAKEMVEVRSPITSTPTNKRSLTNIEKFWVLLYFIVIAIIIVAVVFSFSFLAGASVSVVLALLLTWLWVWLSR